MYGIHGYDEEISADCIMFLTRRSIAERKTYQCRKENECEIKLDSRNVCRACRLRKCYEAGMQINSKESPILPESSSNNNNPDLSSITMIDTSVIIPETIPSRQVLTSVIEP
uniref:Nuclear receptor domain-containing protein n=1 Tax=Acrobeloides nanus TaxID=290746 RepID=A0A914DNC4_9BILA